MCTQRAVVHSMTTESCCVSVFRFVFPSALVLASLVPPNTVLKSENVLVKLARNLCLKSFNIICSGFLMLVLWLDQCLLMLSCTPGHLEKISLVWKY